ncbi:MAG: undecaprenyldiphospho-muramoylpentapeptide beta-N-acetylglucosaminyltransferase [Deltaproteobacteria bacterium]|nr:undecaprenyldiphospho-muramoylpentapeptide beta-N-acetylglucosaminyltransferase [Deltaproteobacteria bacterium]
MGDGNHAGKGRKAEKGRRFIIAAGGTGGHLFPGIAIAKALEARLEGVEIRFVVGRRKMDSEIPGRYGYETLSVDVEGIKGRGWKGGLSALSKLPGGIWQSAGMIRAFSPDLVMGMGSYASAPVCLAARLLGTPTAIHEQNSYPGLANRMLCRVVDRVFISFEESREHFKSGELVWTGNPVREEILEPSRTKSSGHGGFTLLVLGGSLGARAVNEAVTAALTLPEMAGRRPAVIHQTGDADFDRVAAVYRDEGLDADVVPFIQDMASAYHAADLVVSRAGATTIFELAALGKPSILVPYPYAANRHQEINAMSLVRGGGAEMIHQKDLDGAVLARVLLKYMNDAAALAEMGRRAGAAGRPEAASTIVDHILEMVG